MWNQAVERDPGVDINGRDEVAAGREHQQRDLLPPRDQPPPPRDQSPLLVQDQSPSCAQVQTSSMFPYGVLIKRLDEIGFEISKSQPVTPSDGKCGLHGNISFIFNLRC